MAKYFSQEWWDSRTSSQKMVFNVAALVPAARVGGALWKGAQTVRGIRGASTAVSVAKRPVHELAVRHVATYQSLAAGWSLSKSYGPLSRALVVRKKAGMVALGYSAINPFQSINYARKKDWNRLFWNIRYPIVGVPLYNFYLDSKGSGSPPSASSTRTNKKTRRPGGKGRTRPNRPGGKGWKKSPGTRKSSKPGGKGRYGKQRCPPGHYWSKRYKKCIRYRKR